MQYLLFSIAALVVTVFSVIVFLAFMARKYHDMMSRRRIAMINQSSQFKSKKPKPLISNKNDFRAKDKKAEQKLESEISSGVVRYNPRETELETQAEQVDIVGLAEPKGFWSKFIMNQKLGFIMARMNAQKSNNKGYWVNLIKAQESSRSFEQGRGR